MSIRDLDSSKLCSVCLLALYEPTCCLHGTPRNCVLAVFRPNNNNFQQTMSPNAFINFHISSLGSWNCASVSAASLSTHHGEHTSVSKASAPHAFTSLQKLHGACCLRRWTTSSTLNPLGPIDPRSRINLVK